MSEDLPFYAGLGLPFEPRCFFHHNPEDDQPEVTAHVTFKSDLAEEGFLCDGHLERANELNQLTMVRLVSTGISRIMENWRAE